MNLEQHRTYWETRDTHASSLNAAKVLQTLSGNTGKGTVEIARPHEKTQRTGSLLISARYTSYTATERESS